MLDCCSAGLCHHHQSHLLDSNQKMKQRIDNKKSGASCVCVCVPEVVQRWAPDSSTLAVRDLGTLFFYNPNVDDYYLYPFFIDAVSAAAAAVLWTPAGDGRQQCWWPAPNGRLQFYHHYHHHHHHQIKIKQQKTAPATDPISTVTHCTAHTFNSTQFNPKQQSQSFFTHLMLLLEIALW